MPVTAKLSKSFYDALGEDVADQLVDWFNQVDATYRTDLRELNDLNFHRFDAKLGQRLAELRTDLERRISEVEARFDKRLDERLSGLRDEVKEMLTNLGDRLTTVIDQKTATFVTQAQFADFRAEVLEKFNSLLKWIIVLWTGTVLAVITAGFLT